MSEGKQNSKRPICHASRAGNKTGRYAGKAVMTLQYRKAPPKSSGGREEVSLSTRALIAHNLPKLCLRKAVGAPQTASFTSWLPASWRRFSLAPARDMYLFCCVFSCQGTGVKDCLYYRQGKPLEIGGFPGW